MMRFKKLVTNNIPEDGDRDPSHRDVTKTNFIGWTRYKTDFVSIGMIWNQLSQFDTDATKPIEVLVYGRYQNVSISYKFWTSFTR